MDVSVRWTQHLSSIKHNMVIHTQDLLEWLFMRVLCIFGRSGCTTPDTILGGQRALLFKDRSSTRTIKAITWGTREPKRPNPSRSFTFGSPTIENPWPLNASWADANDPEMDHRSPHHIHSRYGIFPTYIFFPSLFVSLYDLLPFKRRARGTKIPIISRWGI